MDDITKWTNRLKRVLKSMPASIEIVVDDGSISIWKAGSHRKHMDSKYNNWGMTGNPEIIDDEIEHFYNDGYIIPYSEGQ